MAYINASGAVDNSVTPTGITPTSPVLDRIQIVKVVLTAAQIQGMFAAPVVILPAPAANQVIVPMDPISIQTKPGTVNFAAGGVVNLVYTGGAIVPHSSSVPAATVNSGTGTTNLLPPIAAVIQPPAATGISITNATGAFTTGNGTMVVKLRFAIQTVD